MKKEIYIILMLCLCGKIFGNEIQNNLSQESKHTESQQTQKNSQTYKEKSGFLLGVHAGTSIINGNIYNANGDQLIWGSSQNGLQLSGRNNEIRFNIGMKVGWNWFFVPLIGIRTYVNYDYNDFRPFTTEKIALEEVSVMTDIILNFINKKTFSFGIFTGIGFGYALEQWSNGDARVEFEKSHSYHGFIVPLNLGISTTLKQQHKIELGTRIPLLMSYYENKANKNKIGIKPYIVSIGYTYIF